MDKTILMIIAPEGFRDEEYFVPKQLLEDTGFRVETASKGVQVAQGKLGGEVEVDLDITNLNPDSYDGIVFIGGGGCKVFQQDQVAHMLAQKFMSDKKLIGAICLAPTILAYSGILKDKCVTVWNGDHHQESIIEQSGGHYVDQHVVVEDNIITASGPDYAEDFGRALITFFEE